MENNKVTGVEIIKDDYVHTVKAQREVIISAGAIESPRLLMLSGIGPREHLEKLHIPVKANLPVGSNLQDHPMCVLEYSLSQPPTIDASESFSQVSKQNNDLQQYLFYTKRLLKMYSHQNAECTQT